jgi:hypothetical protein
VESRGRRRGHAIGGIRDPSPFFPVSSSRHLPPTMAIDSSLLPPLARDFLFDLRCPTHYSPLRRPRRAASCRQADRRPPPTTSIAGCNESPKP